MSNNQLNAICRLQTFMDHKEKEAMINIYLCIQISAMGLSLFLFGTSVLKSPKLQNKVEKIHERTLKFLKSLDC